MAVTKQEFEQLNLFQYITNNGDIMMNPVKDLDESNKIIEMKIEKKEEISKKIVEKKKEEKKPSKATIKKMEKEKKKEEKPMLPEKLKNSILNLKEATLEDFLNQLNVKYVTHKQWSSYKYYEVKGNKLVYDASMYQQPTNTNRNNSGLNFSLICDKQQLKLMSTILYFDEKGIVWSANLKIALDRNLNEFYYSNKNDKNEADVVAFEISPWKVSSKLFSEYSTIQNDEELGNIVKNINPYAFKFCEDYNCDYEVYLQIPYIEILAKAGFKFTENYFSAYRLQKADVEKLNRLCKYGSNPKDIFKTSKTIYTILKDEKNMSLWDTYRKLDKFGRITQDTIQQTYDQGLSDRDLSNMNSILAQKYKGKSIFTWDSLINYLGRLDTFEAIDRVEAFQLLTDYLRMCSILEVEPKIDGDSLKREHDVMARTVRQKKNEVMAQKMVSACEKLKKYDYEESIYMIRGIRDYDDLIDEASQQHNCVASYAERIVKEQSLIYVMREKAHPNRSLITVELSPDLNIRQKFLAYNRSIHNKSQTEFLERWVKFVKTKF